VKKMYENLQVLLNKIRYEEHQWNTCADLKVIGMLPWLRSGYTKFCCFVPSEGTQLQNKKMATPFRNNTRSEKCGTLCFSQ
jgi:hypothetical protein